MLLTDHLSTLRPAEVLSLLIEGYRQSVTYLKFTLQDLILREKLLMRKAAPDRLYLSLNEQSIPENVREYEGMILKYFKNDPDLEWPVKTFINELGRTWKNRLVKREIDKALAPYIQKTFIHKVTGDFSLNPRGHSVKASILAEKHAVRGYVEDHYLRSNNKIKALTIQRGANLMIALGEDSNLMKQVDGALGKVAEGRRARNGEPDFGGFGCGGDFGCNGDSIGCGGD
ncbi:hypothetical protein AB9P05_12810 [Roseivirga sp. BDSF3-8]|uniref:hypothetical protein n=1 Tax=Roseivirga sp. BDSF3-8 TaxID=3241598 RepID=UPI0035321228